MTPEEIAYKLYGQKWLLLDNDKKANLLKQLAQTNLEVIQQAINQADTKEQDRLNSIRTNPVIETALNEKAKQQKALISGSVAAVNQPQVEDKAQDNFTNISNFGQAFKEARSKGLKQFTWKNKNGKVGTYTTQYKEEVQPIKNTNELSSPLTEPKPNLTSLISESTKEALATPLRKIEMPTLQGLLNSVKTTVQNALNPNFNYIIEEKPTQQFYTTQYKEEVQPIKNTNELSSPLTEPKPNLTSLISESTKEALATPLRKIEMPTLQGLLNSVKTTVQNALNPNFNYIIEEKPTQQFARTGKFVYKHQQGNKIQQMLGADDVTFQKFAAYLIDKAKAQGIEANEYIQSLGVEGIKKAFVEFQKTIPMSQKGSKLNYIKQLKGICPEGYEVEYYKNGGDICTRCNKKKVTDVDGTLGYKPLAGKGTKLVQEFKSGKKCKKK